MMKEKIWYEMIDMKYGETYLSSYIAFQRRLKKILSIMTIILSLSGILGWKYFEDYVWIALIIISIMQLFLLIKNEIVRSDEDISKIAELKNMYTKYFNKLEKFWTEFNAGKIDNETAIKHFFDLKTTDWEKIERADTKIGIREYKWLLNKCDIKTTNYINKFHNYG